MDQTPLIISMTFHFAIYVVDNILIPWAPVEKCGGSTVPVFKRSTTTMIEDKSTPPSEILGSRLRGLISHPLNDATSVEPVAKEICGWIDSFKDCNDRLRGLLRLSAELVLGGATAPRPNEVSHRGLGRLCRILDTATDGKHSEFLTSLWKERITEVGFLAKSTTGVESLPRYFALVTFAGELYDGALLKPDTLHSCTRTLSNLGSSFGLELACTLLEATGSTLREDSDGEQCFDAAVQAMLLSSRRDGISADIQHRVQVGLQLLRCRSC